MLFYLNCVIIHAKTVRKMKRILCALVIVFVFPIYINAMTDGDGDLFATNYDRIEAEFSELNSLIPDNVDLNHLSDTEMQTLLQSGLLITHPTNGEGQVFSMFSLFMGPVGVATENQTSGNSPNDNSTVAVVGIAIVVVAILVLVYSVKNPDSEVANTCGNAMSDAISDACASSCENSCSEGIIQLLLK